MNAPPFILTQPLPTPNKRRFRRREYPALNLLIIILYACAGLTFLSLILCLSLLFTGAAAAFAVNAEAGGTAGVLGVIAGLGITIAHASAIIWFVLPAELIRVVIDIQANTQEVAFAGR